MVALKFENDIAIINIGQDENRLNISLISAFHKALDDILKNPDISAMICTANGKFFSNGVDLQNMASSAPDEIKHFWTQYHILLVRILCFPMPTIAALNGHTFAGGCFLSLAFDYRVMNSDKGWMSANEVYMPSRLPEFLVYYLREVLTSSTQRIELLAMGKRFTAAQALSAQLVHAIAPASEVLQKAMDIARERLKLGQLPRDGCGNIKLDNYRDLIPKVDKLMFVEQNKIPMHKL